MLWLHVEVCRDLNNVVPIGRDILYVKYPLTFKEFASDSVFLN